MSRKPVTFIHHEQRNGRITFDQRQKQQIWAHVSRDRWRTKPEHLVLRQSSYNSLTCPKHERRCSCARTGKKLDKELLLYLIAYSPRFIRAPDNLAMLEESYHLISVKTSRARSLCGHGVRQLHDAHRSLGKNLKMYDFTLSLAARHFQLQRTDRAFALFEYAGQQLCMAMKNPVFATGDLHFHSVLAPLAFVLIRQHRLADLVRQFLTQIIHLAKIVFGAEDPTFIVCRNLLAVGVDAHLLAKAALMEFSLPWPDTVPAHMKCDPSPKTELLGATLPLREGEKGFQSIQWQNLNRYSVQALTSAWGEFYLEHQCYPQAAEVVSDASDHWEEWLENGWTVTVPTRAPLSMLLIVSRLTILAKALAGQGLGHKADETFRQALDAGELFVQATGPENPLLIRAQLEYIEFLRSRRRWDEAQELDGRIDAELKQYMLVPDTCA